MTTRIICSHRTDGRRPSELYSIFLDEGIARGTPWTGRKHWRVDGWEWEQGQPLALACPWCGRKKKLTGEDVQEAAVRRVPVIDIALLR